MRDKIWDTNNELGRLFTALNVKTQLEAAHKLDVRQSTLSDCKRRGNIVTGNVLYKALALGLSRDWIKDGTLPMCKELSHSSKKCSAGRYCLEACPALESIQQAVRLISHCSYICDACQFNQPNSG